MTGPYETAIGFADDDLDDFEKFNYIGFKHGIWEPYGFWLLGIPHWFITLIFAVLPAIWFVKWRKRRKFGPNSCGNCGYDLTGNETGECPECGSATTANNSN